MAAGDGLVSMKPTSIAAGVGTASINADGGVDFTAVTSLSLNGVFTSEMDNYLIVISGVPVSSAGTVRLRMRASGTSDSGSNYTRQYLQAVSTAVNGGRSTSQTQATIGSFGDTSLPAGYHVHIYGPALAQATAIRSVNVNTGSSVPNITDNANTHSLSTSYDGCEILPLTASTGTVHVFGYEE